MAQVAIREFRWFWGTTFNSTFVAPTAGNWSVSNSTVRKMRITAFDASGLEHSSVADATLQTRLRGAPAPLETLRTGTMKVSTYLTGGTASSTTADGVTNAIASTMGNVTAVPNKSITLTAGATASNASNISATAIGTNVVAGQGVLFPATGEARIVTNVGTNWFVVNMALSAAPSNLANCVIGHTCYFDESASQRYCDWLSLGKSAADQRQGIGSVAGFSIKGTAPGEAPTIDWELMVADHRLVPTADLTTLTPATATDGGNPPTNKYLGGFFFADAGQQVARAALRAGQFTINPNITFQRLLDLNGVNGVNGWLRNPQGTSAPISVEFTLAKDQDDVGLKDDFEAGTAKQLMIQFGTTTGGTALIYFPKFYIDKVYSDAALDNEAGTKIAGHADDNYVASAEPFSSAMTITTF